MFTWEQVNHIRTCDALAELFTERERARLEALRTRYAETRNCGEFGLDVNRLLFVRWLIDHGRIDEGSQETERLT